MSRIIEAVCLVIVSMLWGATNPLLKLHSAGVNKIQCKGKIQQFIQEFKFLFLNWKYLLSFLANQMGSVFYYVTLSSADLTLAVPITNSLTFVFTALVSRVLGEQAISLRSVVGMALIVSGVLLCVSSKLGADTQSL